MKAYLIDPEQQNIQHIDIASRDDLISHIGYETLETDSLGGNDTLYFDEECFLRGASGRFQIDKLIPVSGKGVIIGTDADGSLQDVTLSLDELKSRVQYL
ncbi:MAG: hypothetical protein QNJ69_14180 [Gammaproteobacteria bacterium]|nr:hypothetical protein [Gammaproteobacteria bacterium]